MSLNLKRLTVRSVSVETTEQLRTLHLMTRLPMSLLIEDAIDLLWGQFQDEGFDLEERLDQAA